MSNKIFPRSPRESMAGWIYLPRFVDKIRLHLAGKLPADYAENFAYKGFDAAWLKTAGLAADAFIVLVKSTVTDGEVCDWVAKNVQKTDAEKAAWSESVLKYGTEGDELKARLQWRKEQSGLSHRTDLQNFVDYIDADEQRL